MCVKSRKADIASQPLIRNTSFVKVIVRNHDNNLTVFEACDQSHGLLDALLPTWEVSVASASVPLAA